MKALIVDTPYTESFKGKFNKIQDKVYDILHLLPYNQDDVEFLSYLADNFLEGLEDYYKENVFVCKSCERLAVKGSICSENYEKDCEKK
jgi:hypothetical protein